jgi:hypothetical protein
LTVAADNIVPFGKYRGHPTPEAASWRRFFEGIWSRVHSLPRPEAERAAFGIVPVEFLNATHPNTDPCRCAEQVFGNADPLHELTHRVCAASWPGFWTRGRYA